MDFKREASGCCAGRGQGGGGREGEAVLDAAFKCGRDKKKNEREKPKKYV